MNDRIEHDTLGDVSVPADRYWGAQTQRSKQNFSIGGQRMPIEVIHALAILKKAAALTNRDAGLLTAQTCALIGDVCDEIVAGALDDEFPLVVWQTGSGTQSNMNVNEVVARRAHVLAGGALGDAKTLIHPNDDVNKSQSSNDSFPTAMHIAAYRLIVEHTLPRVQALRDTLQRKSEQFADVVKIGRTHLMGATPLTLGQELSSFSSQHDHRMRAVRNSLVHLAELALGGTAVGTGLNTPLGYAENVARHIAELTGVRNSLRLKFPTLRTLLLAEAVGLRRDRCGRAPPKAAGYLRGRFSNRLRSARVPVGRKVVLMP